MILAKHTRGTDAYGPVLPASAAIAPHRGDVTTTRAAAYVKVQAAKRVEKLQTHVASHRTAGTVLLPRSDAPAWWHSA